ncbi:MAG: Flp family type IVb pilin [Nocardioides sp.]|uniref:Flp family type IVb pilin n=1 Tax=Nocardioides sp. TaxID=35761 RepID=UPI0039E2B918
MLSHFHITLVGRFARPDERGASAVEYGLLVAGVAAVIAVAVFAFGGSVRDVLFSGSCDTIASHMARSCE